MAVVGAAGYIRYQGGLVKKQAQMELCWAGDKAVGK